MQNVLQYLKNQKKKMLAEDIERIGFLLEDHKPKSWISKPEGIKINSFEFFDGMTVHMIHNPMFDEPDLKYNFPIARFNNE